MTYAAGLPKSKIVSTSSIKTRAANSISTATRSSGASSAMSRTGSLFGIYAQRSTTGLGLHNNYLKYNSPATSALRHSLNDNRTPLFNNIGFMPMPHRHEDSSNKFLGIMTGVAMGVGILKTVIDAVNETKSDKITLKSASANNSVSTNTGTARAENLGDLQTKENKINDNLNNFGENYSKVNQEEKNAIQDALSKENVQAGLKNAGVGNIDFSNLELNEINITADSAEADFDTAIDSISTDIDEVKSFKDDTLAPAKKKLSEKSGELKGNIKATTQNIERNEKTVSELTDSIGDLQRSLASAKTPTEKAQIQTKINRLETQKRDLETKIENDKKKLEELNAELDNVAAAQAAIESAESNCDNLVNQLKEQKDNLKELKEQKSDIEQKQYDLAKEQSQDFEKNKTKMQALETKINHETDPEKKSKLIGEWNSLAGEMSSLYESLSSVNGQSFSGKKGTVQISVDSADVKYTEKLDDDAASVETKGDTKSSSSNNTSNTSKMDNINITQITSKINSTQIGGTVEINGATYTKNYDGNFTLTKEAPLSKFNDAFELRLKNAGIEPHQTQEGLKSYTAEDLIAMATLGQD